jgi:hypothetical protein
MKFTNYIFCHSSGFSDFLNQCGAALRRMWPLYNHMRQLRDAITRLHLSAA